jgi:hypothetical protein
VGVGAGVGDGLGIGDDEELGECRLSWAAAGLDVVDTGEAVPARAAQTPTRTIVK